MKILIVSTHFPPEGSAAVATIAQDLAYRGHEVRVLTGLPERSGAQPRHRFERHGDVDVLRASLTSAGLAVVARGFADGPDLVYVYADGEALASQPWLRRVLEDVPYVLHLQEPEPDASSGPTPLAAQWADKAVDLVRSVRAASLYRRAAAVIGASPSVIAAATDRGAPAERTRLVYDWAEEDAPCERRERPATDPRVRFLCVDDGSQDLATLVRAAKHVEDAPVKITVVGGPATRDRLRADLAEVDAPAVEFRAAPPAGDMHEVYADADFALLCLPTSRAAVPAQFPRFLVEGLPVVAAGRGDLRELVEHRGLGLTAATADPAALAETLREAAALPDTDHEALRGRVRDTYWREFSMLVGVEAIEAALFAAVDSRHVQHRWPLLETTPQKGKE